MTLAVEAQPIPLFYFFVLSMWNHGGWRSVAAPRVLVESLFTPLRSSWKHFQRIGASCSFCRQTHFVAMFWINNVPHVLDQLLPGKHGGFSLNWRGFIRFGSNSEALKTLFCRCQHINCSWQSSLFKCYFIRAVFLTVDNVFDILFILVRLSSTDEHRTRTSDSYLRLWSNHRSSFK